ncbi:MAG TPA: ATP-dependent zinc metalloprotease FtsH [Candidatus Methylacidiphilales bacterium]|nr:ATP-dependent zinc metalloprotease FtsH [Candidatus Methylacidiphilales bacterium]
MPTPPVKYPKPNRNTGKPPVRKGDNDGNNQTPGPGSEPNWKGMLLLSVTMMLLVALYYLAVHPTVTQETMRLSQLIDLVKAGRVDTIVNEPDPSTNNRLFTGTYDKPLSNAPGAALVKGAGAFRVPVDLTLYPDIATTLAKDGYKNIIETENNTNLFWPIFIQLLPILLVFGILYFLFRQQIRMAGKSAFSFGKSKARMMTRDRNKVTFKDVAGIDEAKEELSEIVEFLKDPRRFQKLGGRIPKGVLMIGPPGTGKTLLAKAIAGEADVPFFSISGSDFVEMFVGVGASRVRDMFEQGKKNAPCLIFIDEIDAVGRSRGTGMGGGHDEREQTLNALLVEMDGIETQEGVIIIAATNRKDVLDPALLRPGRFDREVRVNLPDVRGREQILHVHTRNVKLAKTVDLGLIARGTPGYSGAELANVVNEAALLAAKRNKDEVTQAELEEARDKVRWGRERRSMAMTEAEKRATAYHEAGHALLNVLLPNTDALHKVSIIPRGPALGVTMFLPEKDKYSAWKREQLDELVVLMGGRVAEELFLGDVSSGAAGDIQMATYTARKMVCEWGMSEHLGMVQYVEDSAMTFLGRDFGHNRGYSEKTAEAIDAEVLQIVTRAYDKAKELISAHREAMEKITAALLEYETLDGKHIRDIIEHGHMLTPPPAPLLPPSNPNPKEPLPVTPPVKPKEDDGDLLPGLPAPA